MSVLIGILLRGQRGGFGPLTASPNSAFYPQTELVIYAMYQVWEGFSYPEFLTSGGTHQAQIGKYIVGQSVNAVNAI